MPQVSRLIIPDSSRASDEKYVIMAMIKISSVSVMDEWHRNLNHLKIKLLMMPVASPMATEDSARMKKLNRIWNGVLASKLKFF